MSGRDRTSTTTASRRALAAIAGAALFLGWSIEPTTSRAQIAPPGQTMVREPVSLGTLHGNASSTRIWSTPGGVVYEILEHTGPGRETVEDDAGPAPHRPAAPPAGRGFAGVAEIDLDRALDP